MVQQQSPFRWLQEALVGAVSVERVVSDRPAPPAVPEARQIDIVASWPEGTVKRFDGGTEFGYEDAPAAGRLAPCR